MRLLRVVLFASILILPEEAAAQQRELFELFGGMVRSGISAATQADWERVPNAEVACVNSMLRQRGLSVNDMVRQGVSPSDGRIASLRSQCHGQATASGPSFDCRRARTEDEIAICGDPELSRLDRLVSQGFQDVSVRMGESAARALTAPLFAVRRSCGGDVVCIKNAQLAEIRTFQERGASIVNEASAPPSSARLPMAEALYSVDGLHLGGHVSLGSPSYLEYRCNPSEQFAGLTWCQRRRQETSPRGAFGSTNTIVHSDDGTAFYVNRYLEPAFFAGTEAADDVHRLAVKYGDPHYVTSPTVVGAPHTLMATWGEVSLQPLDRARLADLAAGRDVRAGILIDHIGNFQRSASMGLPVYRVTGGVGYVWAASWDNSGRGTLRFLTIDPSRLLPGGAAGAVEVAVDASAQGMPPVQSQQSAVLTPTPTAPSLGSAPSRPADPGASSAQSIAPINPSEQRLASEGVRDAPPVAPPSAPTVQDRPSDKTSSNPAPSDKARVSAGPGDTGASQPSSPARAKLETVPALGLDIGPGSAPLAPAQPSGDVRPKASTSLADASPSPKAPAAVSPAPAVVQPAPRVVGPPIAVQPVAPTENGSNILQWALVAVVVVLLAAVGFLLFERRRRNDVAADGFVAPRNIMDGPKIEQPASVNRVDDVVHMAEPVSMVTEMQMPPPLPMTSDEVSSATPVLGPVKERAAILPNVGGNVQNAEFRPPASTGEIPNLGIWIIVGIVSVSALMTPSVGFAGIIPLLLAAYLLPTIIAFKVRHHYAWALAAINVVFGTTGLAWLGTLVWALTGPRKSALDGMSNYSTLGLSQAPAADPSILMSDSDLRSGWKLPVIDAEIFSFDGHGDPVVSAESIKVFFKNPVIGIWRAASATAPAGTVRYNAKTQVRCVAKIGAETKLRVGRTLGRTALTGIGAAILTGRQGGLGAAFLDYRFAGDETDEVVAVLMVFSDYSSIVVESEREEFEKFCSLLPPHVFSDEVENQTVEAIDRIRRMAADGPRVIDEMKAVIADTVRSITEFADQAANGTTFAERDEGRMALAQAEERLSNERAILNAVDRRIRSLASDPHGRRIA